MSCSDCPSSKYLPTRSVFVVVFFVILNLPRVHSNKAILEIHSVVESSAKNQEQRLLDLRDTTHSHGSLLNNMATTLQEIERTVSSAVMTAHTPVSPVQNALTKTPRSTIRFQASLRPPSSCSRYCKCQCHRTSTIRTPQWARQVVGSLLLQYNGAVSLNPKACDSTTCHSGGARSAKLNYMFPTWLLQQGLFISLGWDALTNRGASLYLKVPTLLSKEIIVAGLWRAVHSGDVEWLREMVMESKLLPTSIDGDDGRGVLAVRSLIISISFSWPKRHIYLTSPVAT